MAKKKEETEIQSPFSGEELANREHLYAEYRKENIGILQNSYENLEKVLFTASAGSLVLTVTFIHDVVPVAYWTLTWLLISAWVSFVLSIFSLTLSYVASVKATNERIDDGQKFFILGDDNSFNRKTFWLTALEWLNSFALILFFIGVTLTLIFAAINLTNYREAILEDQKSNHSEPITRLTNSVPPTSMSQIPIAKQAEIKGKEVPTVSTKAEQTNSVPNNSSNESSKEK